MTDEAPSSPPPPVSFSLSSLPVKQRRPFHPQCALPVELLSAILADPRLSTVDRARCCLVSKTFLSIVRKSLQERIVIDLVVPESRDDDFCVVDRHNKKVFAAMATRPDFLTDARELCIQFSRVRRWFDLDFDPAELKKLDELDACREGSLWGSLYRDKYSLYDLREAHTFPFQEELAKLLRLHPALEVIEFVGHPSRGKYEDSLPEVPLPRLTYLDVPNFPLSQIGSYPTLVHLHASNARLEQVHHLTPGVPLVALTSPLPPRSALQHLFLTDNNLNNVEDLSFFTPFLPDLRSISFPYRPYRSTDSHRRPHTFDLNLTPCTTLSTATIILRSSSAYYWKDQTTLSKSIQFPPSLTHLCLLATLNWPDKHGPLGEQFLHSLPSSVQHLRIDIRAFNLAALLSFFRSPVNLPNLVTLVVLQPDSPAVESGKSAPAAAAAEKARKAREEVVQVGLERGLKVRVESYA